MPRRFALLLGVLAAAASSLLAQTPSSPDSWTVHNIYYPPAGQTQSPADTRWSPNGQLLSYRTHDGALAAWNARTGEQSVLTPAAKLRGVAAQPVDEQDRDHRTRYGQPGYFWSPDGAQVLFDADGTLWLDTLKSGTVRQIGDTGQGSGDDVKFSPDGAMISYVHDHNLYTLRPGSAPIALTNTTDPNLRNSEVDWVYLEELKVRTNYSWSPDSRQIAYVQMDETRVPSYPLTDWIPIHPTVQEQKYPQAGDPNPAVRVGIVSASGGPTRWVRLPDVRPNEDYIPRSGWLNASTVWVETLRRDHRHMDLWFVDAATGEATRALALTDPKFFDENYEIWTPAPGQMLLLSWRTGYTHIDRYTWSTGNPMHGGLHLAGQLEKGSYDVSDIKSVAGDTVYYMSNEGDPMGSQLWSVHMDGTDKRRVLSEPGVHKVAFAKGHEAYTDEYSNLGVPHTLALCTVDGPCRQLWKDGVTNGHTVQIPKVLELKAADRKTTLYATLLLPQGKTAAASVPLINNPYGGPGVQTVTRSWGGPSFLFDQVLAEHGFAVLHVDNRGMGGRGREFTQACYHDFGKVQLADQMAAIDQVLAKYPQLDAKRLGWWGWSWGGTFTLNALTHSTRFRAGISVAPVTDFRLYDSIYTERYLGLPVAEAGEPSDAAAYGAAAVQNTADHLHGHLLIALGTGDDNVHPGNTVQFIQKLIDANEPYDLQIFPRKTHSISGPPARTELYDHMLRFWEQYLMPEGDN